MEDNVDFVAAIGDDKIDRFDEKKKKSKKKKKKNPNSPKKEVAQKDEK